MVSQLTPSPATLSESGGLDAVMWATVGDVQWKMAGCDTGITSKTQMKLF